MIPSNLYYINAPVQTHTHDSKRTGKDIYECNYILVLVMILTYFLFPSLSRTLLFLLTNINEVREFIRIIFVGSFVSAWLTVAGNIGICEYLHVSSFEMHTTQLN